MDGRMVVLDVEMFPKQSLGVKTDGHKDDHVVRLKAPVCRVFYQKCWFVSAPHCPGVFFVFFFKQSVSG